LRVGGGLLKSLGGSDGAGIAGLGQQIGLRACVIERQLQYLLRHSMDVVLQQEIFRSRGGLIDFGNAPVPGDSLVQMIDDIFAGNARIVWGRPWGLALCIAPRGGKTDENGKMSPHEPIL
jgi:hypothetical protein